MQSCYLKQIRTAVVRVDPVSLNHRVAAWLASYFDILFAINGRFHPGEKRLLIYAEELPILPERALSDVGDLCALAASLSQGSQITLNECWHGWMKRLLDLKCAGSVCEKL